MQNQASWYLMSGLSACVGPKSGLCALVESTGYKLVLAQLRENPCTMQKFSCAAKK
jgi:hypothetical protein